LGPRAHCDRRDARHVDRAHRPRRALNGRFVMVQRVTTTTMTRRLNADIQFNARRLADAQSKISSGKQLRRPSDGPADVLRALDQRAELRRYEQYNRNSSDASAWLNSTDSTLSTTVERLQRVRSLVLQGVSGAIDEPERLAIAT